MIAPYIGVTGIVTDDDVETARDCAALMPPSHRFMAGVLVSYRTLRGEHVRSRRYPMLEEARVRTSELAEFCWPVVHYNTRATGGALCEELEQLVVRVPRAQGIQLNIATPDTQAVQDFARDYPEVELILQVNGSSLRACGDVHRYVSWYPAARHALLDLSGGTGAAMDPAWAAGVLRNWRGRARPGVAGGLGPDCGDVLAQIRAMVPGRAFSIDAESRVRVPVERPHPGEKHQDRLDRGRALAYVRVAVAALDSEVRLG